MSRSLDRRDEADRRLDALDLAVAAAEDPLQHAAVLAEAGPQELAVVVLAEPVDVEDLRQLRGVGLRADREPVREVVAPCCSRRTAASRTGRSAARRPCRRRRRSSRSTSSRRGTRRAPSRTPRGRAARPSRGGRRRGTRRSARRPGPPTRRRSPGPATPGTVKRAFGCAAGVSTVGRPVVAVPVDQVRGRLLRHALPPDVAVVGERDVGEDRVRARSRPSRSGWSPRRCPARRRRSRPRG